VYAEVPGQLHDGGLGGGVRHLSGRRSGDGEKRGGVDDRTASRLGVTQPRDAVLARQEDAGEVRVVDPAPGVQAGVQRRPVAGVHQAHVVADHLQPLVPAQNLLVRRHDLRLVRKVRLQRKVTTLWATLSTPTTTPPSTANRSATA
jgi:hypothetical protein